MTRDELLDECVTALEAGTATLEECVQRSFATDADAAETLRAIVVLRSTIAVPAHEADGARERVRALIFAQTNAAPATAVSKGPRGTSVWRRGAGRKIGRWRSIALAAAVLLVCALGIWQTLNAASVALPGSPLYAVKRGTEWIAVTSAWSDRRRGEVLASIAAQRLAEARAVAARHNDALVRSLTGELNSTMHDLILLTAHMKAKHEDTTVVVRALARDLGAEYAALQLARQSGQTVLAQALNPRGRASPPARYRVVLLHHPRASRKKRHPQNLPRHRLLQVHLRHMAQIARAGAGTARAAGRAVETVALRTGALRQASANTATCGQLHCCRRTPSTCELERETITSQRPASSKRCTK